MPNEYVLMVGDRVRSVTTKATGTVVNITPDNGHVAVRWDRISEVVTLPADRVEHLKEAPVKYEQRSGVTGHKPEGPLTPTTEIRTVSETGGEKGVKPEQIGQIPPEFLLALGRVYSFGNSKYEDSAPGRPNWSLGYEWNKSYNAMQRHLAAWWGGQDTDPESGESHLLHAAWHCATLYTFHEKGLGTDDRPRY